MTKNSAREERAAQREQRRNGNNSREGGDVTELRDGLKQAASAAAVGAAVGAARALGARRGRHAEAPEREDVPADEIPAEEEEQPVAGADDSEPELSPQEPPPQQQQDDHAEPATPAAIKDHVRRAQALLRDLLGTDAESVSSVHRTTNGWKVGLVVVEMQRIPDSTDVLANYDVELDDDGGVLGIERTRRYHRSEADRGGRS